MHIAVPCTALLAGSLSKRSEWMRSWNARFAVLTTEALVWHREPGSPEVGTWERPKRRSVVLNSAMAFSVRDGTLYLSQPGVASLCFRAATDEETQVRPPHITGCSRTLLSEPRTALAG